jgi:putative lipoprotein
MIGHLKIDGFLSLPVMITLLFLSVLTACDQTNSSRTPGSLAVTLSVSGSISYRERIALSPQSILEVQLVDVSEADAPATVIAEKSITGPGQVPINFELAYDPSSIDERLTYAIQARISEGDRLVFINDMHTPVLTGGYGNHVEMVLVHVPAPAHTPN